MIIILITILITILMKILMTILMKVLMTIPMKISITILMAILMKILMTILTTIQMTIMMKIRMAILITVLRMKTVMPTVMTKILIRMIMSWFSVRGTQEPSKGATRWRGGLHIAGTWAGTGGEVAGRGYKLGASQVSQLPVASGLGNLTSWETREDNQRERESRRNAWCSHEVLRWYTTLLETNKSVLCRKDLENLLSRNWSICKGMQSKTAFYSIMSTATADFG